VSNACATQEALLKRRSGLRANSICLKCKTGSAARKTSIAQGEHWLTLVKLFRGIADFRLWDMAQIHVVILN
jgi:hypothetical protein